MPQMPNMPSGPQVAQGVASMMTPEQRNQICNEVATQNPALAEQLRNNDEALAEFIQAMMSGEGDEVFDRLDQGGVGGLGGEGAPNRQLSAEEEQAVNRLCELGFTREM